MSGAVLTEEQAQQIEELLSGMLHGTDWNNGTHSKMYRPKFPEVLATIRAARAQAKCADPVRTKGLGETMAEYLGERLHRDSFVRRAVSLPEPMEYPPVYPDESRQEQSTAYQYRKGWNDCLARCKQSNLSMQEQAGIKEWEKLKNPQTLFVNLNCGFPAQLERDHLVHLLNKVDPVEPGPVAEVVYQTATDSYGTSRLDSKTIVPYKPISELAVGTKLYRYPVRTKDLTKADFKEIAQATLGQCNEDVYNAVIAKYKEKNS